MALGLGLGLQNENKVSEAGFSLTDVAGLQLWAKNKTDVTTGATLTWADQSGNGNDLTQTVANSKPTYAAADGSFDFTGSNNSVPLYMDMDATLSLQAFSAFYVVEMTIDAVNEFYGLSQLVTDANNRYIQMFGNTTATYSYLIGGSASNTKVNALQNTSNAPTNGTKFIFGVSKSSIASGTTVFTNNGDTMNSSTTYSSPAPVQINSLGYKVNGGRSFDGKIYEVAFYNQYISGDDYTNIINDLKSRNGIS
jgi:hypothetical protein